MMALDMFEWAQAQKAIQTGTPEEKKAAEDLIAKNASSSGLTGQLTALPGRIGEATGLIKPSDTIDENALYGPTGARATSLYEQSLKDAEAARGFRGPSPIETGTITTSAPITQDRIYQPTPGEAYGAGPVERYDPSQVQGPASVAAPTVTADMMAAPLQTQRVNVGRAELGAEANALRSEQVNAARSIGTAPSAAASMFDAALGKISREQLGAASQARGSERAGARREAMLAIGQSGIEAASAAAAESAREEQAKRSGLAQALSGVRTTDVDVASTQARLAQEANNLDAQIQAETARGNTAGANALRQRQAELNLQARTSTAELGVTTAQGNAARQLAVAQANADAMNKAREFGAGAANLSAEEFAKRRTAVEQSNIQRDVDVSTTNATNKLAVDKANADAYNRAAEEQVKLRQAGAIATGEQAISAQNTRQTGVQGATSGATSAAELELRAAEAKASAKKAQADAEAAANERLVKTGTTIAAKSDERVKRDVDTVSDADLSALADDIQAVTFRYKPGVEDNGDARHAGVMAQNLERSKLGRTLVSEDAVGTKSVDYASLAALMAAAAARTMRKHANG